MVPMPRFSYRTALKASTFANLFFIAFFVAFFAARASHAPPPPPTPAGTVRLIIDLRNLELIVAQGHRVQKTFPVAIGKRKTPSPVGQWEIVSKEKWGEGFGSRWLGLNVPFGVYGIHGTNKPNSIGNIISGGCIRMFNRHVEQVYNLVQVGTPVQILGDPFMGRRVLLRGLSGSDVFFLQKRLRQLGLFRAAPNGIFGYSTEQALLQFQKQNNLPLTGQVKSLEYKRLRLIHHD